MNLRQALAGAIKSVRKIRHLTQEDFETVSSRTYLSSLERGLKSPTLDKLNDLSQVMGVRPASLVLLAYVILNGNDETVIDEVVKETKLLISATQSGKRSISD